MSHLTPPTPVILQGSGGLEFKGLNFGSLDLEPATMLCTECFCRKPSAMFGDTDDVCGDCKEIYGL